MRSSAANEKPRSVTAGLSETIGSRTLLRRFAAGFVGFANEILFAGAAGAFGDTGRLTATVTEIVELRTAHVARTVAAALKLARGVSSLHVLFPPEVEARELEAAGLMLRRGVQFHWANAGYASFDAFLAALTHDKRKKIRQERRRVAEAGITLRRKVGAEITPLRK